jgi:ATP-dependent DNA helicase RecG
VGIEDKKISGERTVGFSTIEAANDTIITLLEDTKPAVENVELEFM